MAKNEWNHYIVKIKIRKSEQNDFSGRYMLDKALYGHPIFIESIKRRR